ncbi:DUF309 domain-containing protein [Bacillus sp. 1P06AnD]|uniref:DUF309 domain-containing protein n=1 Tax=Bacillus sp. 1P06AnD TaxID=3132208 RepID=UPI00399F14DC
MNYPEPYVLFLIEFHAKRDYFECHELLEDYWKEQEPGGKRESIWVVLIQLAVASYHFRRGNLLGASKMLDKAFSNLHSVDGNIVHSIGLDFALLEKRILSEQSRLNDGLPYRPYNLPIVDTALLDECRQLCGQQGIEWDNNCPVSEQIMNKHLYRHGKKGAYTKKRTSE